MAPQNLYDDWTGNVVADATVRSLDPEAVRAVRARFVSSFPDRSDESDGWDDETFLNKVGFFKRGKVTNAAMVLLGKQSEPQIPQSVCIRWRLVDVDGSMMDSRTLWRPLVISVRQAASVIRNPSVTIFRDGRPEVVSMYRVSTLTEALFNAVAHQDYEAGGTIDLVERDRESITVSSKGSFPSISPESFVTSRPQVMHGRNAFLRKAMASVGLVPSSYSGIRSMYLSQAHRHFPMPRFDIRDDSVSVTIPGRRYGQYCRLLDERGDLSISDMVDLDRFSNGAYLPDRRIGEFVRRGIMTSSSGMACIADQSADRSADSLPGTDRDAIIAMMEERGSVSRADVVGLLRSRDRMSLSDDRLAVRSTNLLQSMRREGTVRKVDGSTKSARYELVR